MKDLLENEGIKKYTERLLEKENKMREEQEMVIAFLQKNMPEINKLVNSGTLSSNSEDIVKFINDTCDINIIMTDAVRDFISDHFEPSIWKVLQSGFLKFITAFIINYIFWYIVVNAFAVIILQDFSSGLKIGASIILSLLSLLYVKLKPS